MQHYLMLSRGNFYAENSLVTRFCHLALGGPVIMPHRVCIGCYFSVNVLASPHGPELKIASLYHKLRARIVKVVRVQRCDNKIMTDEVAYPAHIIRFRYISY